MPILIYWGLLLLAFMLGVTLGTGVKLASRTRRKPPQTRCIEN